MQHMNAMLYCGRSHILNFVLGNVWNNPILKRYQIALDLCFMVVSEYWKNTSMRHEMA